MIVQAIWLGACCSEDYDLYNGGWGSDYPRSINILIFFSVKSGGVLQNLETGESNDKAKAVGLDIYTQMLEKKPMRSKNLQVYEKYADIQAWLVDSALAIKCFRAGTPVLKNSSFLRTIFISW